MNLELERRILMASSRNKKIRSKNIYHSDYKKSDKPEKDVTNKNIKEKLTEALELPKEILLNMSKITMVGSQELIIENYKGVVEYGSNRIRINTGNGLVKISGNNLAIKEITSEDIKISGQIGTLEFQS